METFKLRKDRVQVTRGGQWQVKSYIALNWHGRLKDGETILTPDCRTAKEVKYWADELIKELELIKRKADRIKWNNHPLSGLNC